MVVNLVRCHPVNELVAKLKSGKTIAKDQVVRESKSGQANAERCCPLTSIISDKPCRRCGHSDYVLRHVSQMSSVDSKNRRTLSFIHLQP